MQVIGQLTQVHDLLQNYHNRFQQGVFVQVVFDQLNVLIAHMIISYDMDYQRREFLVQHQLQDLGRILGGDVDVPDYDFHVHVHLLLLENGFEFAQYIFVELGVVVHHPILDDQIQLGPGHVQPSRIRSIDLKLFKQHRYVGMPVEPLS